MENNENGKPSETERDRRARDVETTSGHGSERSEESEEARRVSESAQGGSERSREGEPVSRSGASIINEDIIRTSLQSVVDPEIGFSIVDLGLVYEVQIDPEANVIIRMTLTSPACPVGPEILASAHMAALNTPGVKNVKVDLVWDPPWDPRVHASDDVKLEFGIL